MKEPLRVIFEGNLLCEICGEYTEHRKYATRSKTNIHVICLECGNRYVQNQENWEGKGYDILQDLW